MQVDILWPTFLLVALVYAVWLLMFVKRSGHMKANPPAKEDLATGEAALRYFSPVEMPANNLRNLFEMPVLYFALVPLLLITRHADHLQIFLAWIFVLLRVAHSVIHATRGPVMARFAVYALSCAILSAMWIGFAIDIASGR
ncbi:MAPEG family protein [Sphingobium phenoxybenzoativorans]|uniref:MAPEG family protein n=1 Tax=Sphingobium phenoxybenzoativorans TaxID=1592790 RepID=A0A975K3K1_9SPHN|nr:MAPEG family protein [Sphingobium phenoxybenzoativorans]QUT03917.1 MAPEG family protein [Sphingobium phenoxybenzoativorans]